MTRFGIGPWIAAIDLAVVAAVLYGFGPGLVPALLTAPVFVLLAASSGLYRSRLDPSALNDAAALTGRLVIAATITYVLSSRGTNTVSSLGTDFGRGWWLSIAATVPLIVLARAAFYFGMRFSRRRGWVAHRTLIVGAGSVGAELADMLAEHREYGLLPVAFHDPFPARGPDRRLPVFDKTSLGESIHATQASCVVIAFASLPDSMLVEYIQSYHLEEAEFFFVPRLFEISSASGRDVERIRSLPLVRLRRAPNRSVKWQAKLILDKFFAAVALVLLSPLLLAIGLAVRSSLGSGVIFTQDRVGLDGRRFTILKFRTMPVASEQESDTTWDAQTTRKPTSLGAILRATSLDELPQLWNILKGDMSFVGPRPERPHFVGEFANDNRRYNSRHRVPCGLTGLAQINGLRGDTSIAERTKYDNVYVETWSLGNDAKILLRTVLSMIPIGRR